MKKFLGRWFRRFPTTYCIVVGIGGAAVIIAVIDGAAYLIGGPKLMDATSILSIGLGVVWILKYFFKLKLLEFEKELFSDRTSS